MVLKLSQLARQTGNDKILSPRPPKRDEGTPETAPASTPTPAPAPAHPPAPAPAPVLPNGPDPLNELKFTLYDRLLRELDHDKLQQKQGPGLRRAVEEAISTLIEGLDTPISRQDRHRLVREVSDEILGLGPIEPLLADDDVSEVMVNGPNRIFVERKGILVLTDATFRDDSHVMRIIERIVAPLGRRIDEASPMVDGRLADGSRVNAIIPPLAVDGPTITIRKFSRDPLTIEDLIRFGTITPAAATFLQACVHSRINMIVSGGTGTGKTTMLNVLSSFIPHNERIVTIEDPCELQLRQPHIVRLETRPPNIEGKGEISQRQLVKNALRMRPDRIVIGEVRSGEAFDMLQAMNTGHDGSLTTTHANAPRDAVARVENMVLMANLDLPIRAIREQIASAINLIVQLSRLRDGTRRVTHITEVVGMEGDVMTLQDVFLFKQQGVDAQGKIIGELRPTGLRPRAAERCEREGLTFPPDLFLDLSPGDGKWKR